MNTQMMERYFVCGIYNKSVSDEVRLDDLHGQVIWLHCRDWSIATWNIEKATSRQHQSWAASDVLAFGTLTNELHKNCDFLPVRFGCCCTYHEIDEWLKRDNLLLSQQLAFIKDHSEVSVNWIIQNLSHSIELNNQSLTSIAIKPVNGRTYLKSKCQESKRIFAAEDLANNIAQQFRCLAGTSCKKVQTSASWFDIDMSRAGQASIIGNRLIRICLHILIKRSFVCGAIDMASQIEVQSIERSIAGPLAPSSFLDQLET